MSVLHDNLLVIGGSLDRALPQAADCIGRPRAGAAQAVVNNKVRFQ
jgi:hypothetical protein